MDARPTFDRYFLRIAEAVAVRADCRRRQAGAVIVDTSRRIVSTGYNGVAPGEQGCLEGACPRGLLSEDEAPPYSSYDTGPGTCIANHAEANALMYGDWAGFQDGAIYTTSQPCVGCFRLIKASGLRSAIWPDGSWRRVSG